MSAPTLFLFGTHELCFDDKSRTVMPASFRRLLADECAGSLVVTQSIFDPCLWIYPYPMWEQLLAALNAQANPTTPALQSLQRLLLSSASAVKLDAQGRFAVSSTLRSYAGIEEKKAFLVGMQHKFELWAPAALQQRQEQDRQQVQAAFASAALSAQLGNVRI